MFNFKVPTYLLTALVAGLILSGCPSENTENSEQTTHTEQTTTETKTETQTQASTAPANQTPVATIGKLSRAEFERLSAEAGAAIAGVKPSGKALSAGDKALLIEIANHNLLQLVLSIPTSSASGTESVRVLAEAEAMEQRGLAAKLQELATPAQVTLPSDKDPKLMDKLKQMQAKSGTALDRAFINDAGISGHQQFEQLMSKVQKQAADPALKQLATAMLPQIKQQLQISRDILAQLPAS